MECTSPAVSAFPKYKEGMEFCAAVDTETGPDTGNETEDLQGRVLHSKEKGLRLSHRQQHLRGRRCFERDVFYHFKTKDELLVYYNYQKFAEFREKNNFSEAVAGKAFDERILLFYYYWSDYMLDVGLDFCCNYYNTKNTSIDTRRWHQRQPAYVWGYPDSCLQEAAEQGLLKPGYPPDHYGEVVVTIMKGIAFDWCLSGAAFDMHERLDEIMVPYLRSIQTAPPETTGA